MNFVTNVRETIVTPGSLAIFWLGQAGFLIKTTSGKLIAIDPYLSDCVQRLIPEEGTGFKRLTPSLMNADELIFDALLISHEHNDHFDVDSIYTLLEDTYTELYTNKPVANEIAAMNIDMKRVHTLEKGSSILLDEFTIMPVDCDHGELAPEALGFILDFGFTKIYYAGDTALNEGRLQEAIMSKPDIAILPINGEFGNMNGKEASEYAGILGCKVCIPCHFWTFAKHRGDPQLIIDNIGKDAKGCQLVLLCQGEAYISNINTNK